jgi:tRNA uridine 5-carboxymethylaminomethyl modification enzyme
MHLQKIPDFIDYKKIGGLSNEVQEKLTKYKPESLAHCLKISGITPAAVGILMIYLKTGIQKISAN